MNFAEKFTEQLNNDNCDILSGIMIGQTVTIISFIKIGIMYIFIKIIDKFCIEPLLNWFKNKTKKWREQ